VLFSAIPKQGTRKGQQPEKQTQHQKRVGKTVQEYNIKINRDSSIEMPNPSQKACWHGSVGKQSDCDLC
jgi:hypothetical protein